MGTVITGDITEDLLVPTGNYTLKGSVFVKDGATLTIEKGSTITVTAADQAAGVNLIIVERGGKIIADGTAAEPIVFTSENQNAEGGDGDWGGIGIHGKARINAPGGESLSEAGQVPYGGNDDADSSGILRFVRIEYAGAASSDGSFEFNAFSFFGVGSGTILQNCEAFEGADDGFEFFGGTVNGTNLSMVGMEDDSIDWDEGYRGTLNNIVIYQYDNIGDFAFELANRSGENNATPRSRANVNDVTVRGSNRSGKAAFDLKQGTGGIFNNIVVTNVESVIFLNNQLQEVQNGDLEFTNANFTYSTNLVVNNVDGTDVSALFISENPSATGANTNAFTGWSRFDEL
ncbi:MAG: multidrug transporter [Flavobacteriaceae bacterium]